ncbi:MAG: A/G-specific adenine glycosylase [Bdellovibrionota bacterium]
MSQKEISKDQSSLLAWYAKSKRDLPWRLNRDPYRIWISEIMLQQTTVAAVVPFYERFVARFPDVQALAKADVGDVLEHWAGLGYYSRARNLHKAAQVLAANGFPKTFAELSELSGFGPYTARAVSSQAFNEKTGVLDGNVIRVLSRRHGIRSEWWKTVSRNALQELSDQLAQIENPSDLNQGLMELGATVCTPASPACILCPWSKVCVARKEGIVLELPLKRPRKEREIWVWQPIVDIKDKSVLLVENDYAPFLRGHWILPGTVKRVKSAPKRFQFRGSVTHHDIFVEPVKGRAKITKGKTPVKRVALSEMKKQIPASLIRKAIEWK